MPAARRSNSCRLTESLIRIAEPGYDKTPKIWLLGKDLDDIVRRVSEIIPRYSMLVPGDKVGVAVSGGADSVILLHLLHRLISSFAIHLTVLHVNHGLRGDESDADEQFVRNLADTLGLPFVTAQAEPAPGNLEQEARRARRAFFANCRREYRLQKIALGHTKSDQAETVLYRFLKGSGITGLAGMRPVTEEGFIRPLLGLTRPEVRAWALANQFQWREDSSNADPVFARNLLRNTVIPALASEFNPNLEGTLAGMAEIAAAEEDFWHFHIQPIYLQMVSKCDLGLVLRVSALTASHVAVQRRLIRCAIAQIRGDLRSIDSQHVDAVLELCKSEYGHDRVLIPGVDALRSFGILLLAKPGELNADPRNYSIELTPGTRLKLPFGAGFVELRLLNSNHINCVNFKDERTGPSMPVAQNDREESQFPKEVADLDFEALTSRTSAARLQVRNWRPGDEMVRPEHHKPEKIKSLFQEYRVLLWKRRHWPLAVANDEIVWARNFGAASPFIAKPDTRNIVTLYYWPPDDAMG